MYHDIDVIALQRDTLHRHGVTPIQHREYARLCRSSSSAAATDPFGGRVNHPPDSFVASARYMKKRGAPLK
jgi:hypothetical protein